MRLFTASALLLLAAAWGEACSLFIPFDEYAGSPAAVPSGADGGDAGPAPSDGGADADAAATCKDVDTKSDPANCGACGRRCANAGGCDAGRCPVEVVLEPLDAGVVSLAVVPSADAAAPGSDEVYLTGAGGDLLRTLAGSGTAERAPTNAVTGPVSLAAVGAVGVFGAGSAIDVFHAATFDAAAPTVVSGTVAGLTALSMQGEVAYWGDVDGLWWKDVRAGGPKSGPLDGSAPPVAFDQILPVVYWTTFDGTVYRMDTRTPGFAATVVAAAAPGVESIAAGRKDIVLGQKSQGLLVFELDAAQQGTLTRKVAMADPQALATDSVHVYAVDVGAGAGRGKLYRILPDGTEVITLADTFTGGRALALGAEYVYYADGSRILRTTK